MEKIITFLSDTLVESNIIEKNKIKIFRYGMEVFLLSVFEILSILLLSLYISNTLNTIMFFGAFLPLRLYAGGYHAKTRFSCFMILVAVYAAMTCITESLVNDHLSKIITLTTIINIIIVLVYAPVINPNKKRNKQEIATYKKKSRAILMLQTIFIIIYQFIFRNLSPLFSFVIGQSAVTTSMLFSIIKMGGEHHE